MGFFNLFKKKKAKQLAPVQTKGIRKLGRSKKEYVAQCELVFDGKPLRSLEMSVVAYTGLEASKKIEQGLKIQVKKVFINRSKQKR